MTLASAMKMERADLTDADLCDADVEVLWVALRANQPQPHCHWL